jgi:L-threonylcarbamoyladenylate synthase
LIFKKSINNFMHRHSNHLTNFENLNHARRNYKIPRNNKRGGIILYPTDTVWGGCDATNAEAVAKIYKLKQKPKPKA